MGKATGKKGLRVGLKTKKEKHVAKGPRTHARPQSPFLSFFLGH